MKSLPWCLLVVVRHWDALARDRERAVAIAGDHIMIIGMGCGCGGGLNVTEGGHRTTCPTHRATRRERQTEGERSGQKQEEQKRTRGSIII